MFVWIEASLFASPELNFRLSRLLAAGLIKRILFRLSENNFFSYLTSNVKCSSHFMSSLLLVGPRIFCDLKLYTISNQIYISPPSLSLIPSHSTVSSFFTWNILHTSCALKVRNKSSIDPYLRLQRCLQMVPLVCAILWALPLPTHHLHSAPHQSFSFFKDNKFFPHIQIVWEYYRFVKKLISLLRFIWSRFQSLPLCR